MRDEGKTIETWLHGKRGGGQGLGSGAGLSSQLDGRPLAAVFVQHYVFTSMLSSHKSLRSLIMITFSVSFQPFEVLTSSFHTSNLLKNEISKFFFFVKKSLKNMLKVLRKSLMNDR